ncbi:methyltransferase domain-containing protein [Candidatus Poribacteria bacterium]
MAIARYYTQVVPGLERVAWKEIRAKLDDVELIAEEKGRLLFRYAGDPRDLLYLRSVENAYAFIRHIRGVTRSRKSLGEVFKRVKSADVQTAMALHKRAHRSKGKKRLTFRVITSKLGRHNFRRVDLQQAAETALVDKYGWRINRQNPTLEFRMDLEESDALFGLRLTDETTRQRSYKIAHLPASLKPTVAYCMVLLSEPSPTDVFVDPMCGAGTIPIERAFFGPYDKITGGDISEDIVMSAKSNVEASRRSIDLELWNVSAMPLPDHSVDRIVCNLPFGKRIGSQTENQRLYSSFFKEMVRVLKPGGKAVLLTSERELMKQLFQQYRSINMRRYLRIDLLGVRAYIYVIDAY